MPVAVLRQVRQALSNLNPADVRETANRPVRIGLIAPSAQLLGEMEAYLVPAHLSAQRRAESARMLIRGGGPECDVEIYSDSVLRPPDAFSFSSEDPDASAR